MKIELDVSGIEYNRCGIDKLLVCVFLIILLYPGINLVSTMAASIAAATIGTLIIVKQYKFNKCVYLQHLAFFGITIANLWYYVAKYLI